MKKMLVVTIVITMLASFAFAQSENWTAGNLNALVKNLGEKNVRRVRRGEKFDLKFEESEYLTLIKQDLILPATTGNRLISQAEDVFTGYIASNFINWGANEPSQSTKETKVSVYEMKKNGTLQQMFNSLGNPEDLCLTQDQIISFVENHREHLRKKGYGTFFLFKSNDQFFGARVNVGGDGELFMSAGHFDYSRIWDAGDRHRLVVLQQA